MKKKPSKKQEAKPETPPTYIEAMRKISWGQGDRAMQPEPGKDRYFVTAGGKVDNENWEPGPDDWPLFSEMMRDRVNSMFAAPLGLSPSRVYRAFFRSSQANNRSEGQQTDVPDRAGLQDSKIALLTFSPCDSIKQQKKEGKRDGGKMRLHLEFTAHFSRLAGHMVRASKKRCRYRERGGNPMSGPYCWTSSASAAAAAASS